MVESFVEGTPINCPAPKSISSAVIDATPSGILIAPDAIPDTKDVSPLTSYFLLQVIQYQSHLCLL